MDKRNTLEPTFEPQRAYVVKGSLLNQIARALQLLTPIAGPNIELKQVSQGVIITGKPGGAAAEECNFSTTFSDEDGLKIRGGVVYGGGGAIEVDDTVIRASGASAPADGTQVWLHVEFDATVEDDVLLPGGDVTGASIASGGSIPDTDIPTASSSSGEVNIQLGSWFGGKFGSAGGCGNFQIFHCPGSLSWSRG
jgi:hypothetical protein